ncbi:MAG: ATP-dependent Clp protease adaptor ClpS [Mariniphaga sp.]
MTSKETKKKPVSRQSDETCSEYLLMLHNDDVHSFDYVINALMDICEHDFEQAVQCTMITHHKGSCDVRKGKIGKLKQMKDALTALELSATIEMQS